MSRRDNLEAYVKLARYRIDEMRKDGDDKKKNFVLKFKLKQFKKKMFQKIAAKYGLEMDRPEYQDGSVYISFHTLDGRDLTKDEIQQELNRRES